MYCLTARRVVCFHWQKVVCVCGRVAISSVFFLLVSDTRYEMGSHAVEAFNNSSSDITHTAVSWLVYYWFACGVTLKM